MATSNSDAVKRMLRSRGALVAAVTALVVGVILLAQNLLLQLIGGIVDFPASALLTVIVPFVVGYFLALWIVAPISEQLGIGYVIARSVVAIGIGCTLVFVVLGAVSVVGDLLAVHPAQIFTGLWLALQQALSQLVVVFPLGVLGAVLLWHYRSAHPAQFHVSGLIDVEVPH